MAELHVIEQSISGVFKSQESLQQVVPELLKRGIPHDHMTAMGRTSATQVLVADSISDRGIVFREIRLDAVKDPDSDSTQLSAGEYLIVIQTTTDRVSEFQQVLEQAGGTNLLVP